MHSIDLNSPISKVQRSNYPEVPFVKLDTLWLQVGGTLCNLQCKHCFISCSPQNHTHEMMNLKDVQQRLNESRDLGVKYYYITGGEVFMNPEIFEILTTILEYGPLDVLTNGTLITSKKAARLREIQNSSSHKLQFRVSMESFEKKLNDQTRGQNSFSKASEGIRNLSSFGFSSILTVTRYWDEAKDTEMEKSFQQFLSSLNVPYPKVKILPGFLLGQLATNTRSYSNNEHVTEKCFENYDITNLQCSSSRMATKTGVYVCPILVDNNNARMGDTIEETLRPFPLAHSACYTCRITGMTCQSE
jgi:AdoMet-dependent heme synthase